MKTIAITFCAIALVFSAAAQEVALATGPENKAPLNNASFSWANTVFDFGKIVQGVPVSYEFRFTNTGMVPLIISAVRTSCGCTVTAYSKDPVEKGSAGFVRATYNAATVGQFTKTLAITANTPEGSLQLTIKGEVVAGK